ncbi:MAG TPA: hypothetical protein DCD97_00605 [Firmicutes bacterium]|nr:hypothetical protein [Bacillota bacterium]
MLEKSNRAGTRYREPGPVEARPGKPGERPFQSCAPTKSPLWEIGWNRGKQSPSLACLGLFYLILK